MEHLMTKTISTNDIAIGTLTAKGTILAKDIVADTIVTKDGRKYKPVSMLKDFQYDKKDVETFCGYGLILECVAVENLKLEEESYENQRSDTVS